MRLHFTGLSHIDLPVLYTHTHTTDAYTCPTLCPWFWHLHYTHTFFLSMWSWRYRLKLHSITVYLLFQLPARHISCFCLSILPPTIHPPSLVVFSTLPRLEVKKSHQQGQREIMQHQIVTNRTVEIVRLSSQIKFKLWQTSKGDW